MPERLSETDIIKYIGPIKPPGFALSISHAGRKLLTYKNAKIIFENNANRNGKESAQVEAALVYAGIYEHLFQLQKKDGTHNEADGTPVSDPKRFREWLREFLGLGEAGCFLVPDTNFLLRHYATNLSLAEVIDEKLTMGIPRLAILELEAITQRKEETWQKSQCFTAFADIMKLRDCGAILLDPISEATLRSFADIAGKGWADAWIRREIHNLKNPPGPFEIFFLTSDFTNAFASNAEGISTLYIARKDLSEAVGLYRFVRLIVGMAILFETVEVASEVDGRKVTGGTFNGIWAGKSIRDWRDNLILFEEKLRAG
jgi:hypothetical protein